MPDFADQLLAELDSAPCWPLPREKDYRRRVVERRAFRTRDKHTLRQLANWDRHTKNGVGREYLVDPLGKLIAKSFADFLFGEDPTIEAHSDRDQESLEESVEENRLGFGLHRAERICSSEGESWWHIHHNGEIAETGLLEWLSRLNVVPLFYGDRLLAAAIVTCVAKTQETYGQDGDAVEAEIHYRHAEVHTKGRVVNVLYRGTEDELGTRTALERRPETAALEEEWPHGLEMLVGRIVNDVDEDPCLGESDYDSIEDQLLALNEAFTISVENARLTGKDRIFSAGRFLEADGNFDASMDVFQVEAEGATLGEGDSKPPIVAIEKSYDAEPLWLHITKLTHTALTRVGLVAQWIGEEIEGNTSGTAIRLRFLPTVNSSEGKARPWDADLPKIIDLLLRVGQVVFKRPYDGAELPTVERQDPLPVDEAEQVTINATAVTAEIRSRETAIRAQHPDWTDTEVEAELKRIAADTRLPGPLEEDPEPPPPEPEPVT